LNARWIIKDGATDKDLYASETLAVSPVTAVDGSTPIALSEDVGTLSKDIASRVSALTEQHSAETGFRPGVDQD
jgi:hypothetical protein